MINILVPLGGKSVFFDSKEYIYPKPIIDIGGKPMIQHTIENLNQIEGEKRFIFVASTQDCTKFHLDNILRLLTDNNCDIIQLPKDTKGAVCSALMAIEHINTDDQLIISNGDQIVEEDLNHVLSHFNERNIDAGTICFESVHPKWSFVRLDENNKIVQTAEKQPISKFAIAGFYYFRKGKDFVESAMRTIEKGAEVNGLYFIAPTLNEMVLENRNLEMYSIKPHQYINFYSPKRIEDYEQQLRKRSHHS